MDQFSFLHNFKKWSDESIFHSSRKILVTIDWLNIGVSDSEIRSGLAEIQSDSRRLRFTEF